MTRFVIFLLLKFTIAQILNTSLNYCESTNSEHKCLEINQSICRIRNDICPNDWACIDLYHGFICRPHNTENFALQHLPWHETTRRQKRANTLNQCSKILCQNGAICQKGHCKCLKHHMGKFCSEQINYCIEIPCKHKSKCVPRVGGFTCECPQRLAGKFCQLPVQQAIYNMQRPNFIYQPLQYAGFKYHYVFHTEGLGVLPETEVDFGDGTIIKKVHGSVILDNAFATLIKYFPPPLNIMSDKLEAYFFTHIYQEAKIYTIKVRAWNKYQEIYNSDYELRVIPVHGCSLDVTLHNAAVNRKVLNLYRQDSINFMSTAWSNCMDLKLHYQWDIYKVKHFKADLTKKYRIKGNSVVLHNSNLVIPPFTLDYGNYTMILHVEMVKPKSGIKRKVTTWLSINQRPIIAHIQGGSQIFINSKSRFYLDASMSYDPNYGRNKQPLMSFKWMCQPLSDFCKGFRALNENGSILIVPVHGLSSNKHTFTVYVNHYKATEIMSENTGIAKQSVNPVQKILPLFSIRCLRNCIGGRANNMYIIALRGISVVKLNEKKRTYTNWLVYQHPQSNQQSVMDLDNTEYTEGNSLMIVYAEQLEPGDVFKFLYTGYVQQTSITLQSRNVTFAYFYLTTNKPPDIRACHVNPKEGYAMLSTFSLKCEGLDPKKGILYEVIQFTDLEDRENSGALVAYDYSNIIKNFTLNPGLRKNDYITTLHITATDHNGVAAFIEISVTVFPLIYYLKDPSDVLQKLLLVGTGLNSPLNILLSSGNYFELVQEITSTCFTLQHFLKSEDALYIDSKHTYNSVEEIRDILMSYLYQIPVSTVQSIKHIATALDKVMNLPSKTEIWTTSTVIGIDIMNNLIQKLEDRFKIYDEEVFQNDMDDIGIMLINIASSIFKTPSADSHVLREGDTGSESNRLIRRKYTEQINPFKINPETLTNHDSADTMDVIERFMRLYMTYKIPNERTTLFTNAQVSLIMKKASPEHLTMRSLALANTISLYPLFDQNLYGKHAIYNLEMIVMNENPNWYNNDKHEGLPFPFVKINLTNDVDGSPIDADMVVYMRPIRAQPLQIYNGSLPIRLFWQIKEKHIKVHRIIVPKGAKPIVQFFPIQDNHRLRVVIKKEMRPRMVDFWLNGINIPQYVSKSARDKGLSIFVDDEATDDNTFFYLGVLPHIDTLKILMKDVEEPILPHMFHYDEELYDEGDILDYYESITESTKEDENTDIQYIKHIKKVSDAVYNNRTLPYAFSAHSIRCVTWNEASKHWKPSCNVRASTSSARVVCNCTGHDPVTVSYQKVSVRYQEYTRTIYFLQYVDNPLIPFVVLFSLILFIGLFKWAAEEDRKDRLRRTVCVLVDNYPQCEYCYLIIIQTGHKIKSGTTSKVTIELEGTYATSLPHVLTDWKRDVMERGSKEWFLLKTMKPLGEIYCLHIWTDYSGAKPSWYCNKVIVHDVQEQQVWFFMVNKWFDPINGDGTMSYTIYQSRHEKIFATSYQVQEHMVREFESGMHGWLSVLFKHPYSGYTRKQRASVAYAHMVLIMMVLIYLNELPVADSPQHQMYKTGSYELEIRDLFVAFYALLVALPIHSILVLWFRCVRPSSQWTDVRLDEDYSRFNIARTQSENILWINPEIKKGDIKTTSRPKPKRKHVSFYADFYEPEGERELRSKWSLEELEKKAGDEMVVPLRAPTSVIETESTYDVTTEPPDEISAIYGQEVVSHSYCCPPYCVLVGWVLVFAVTVPCVYITTLYGIAYGWVMSLHYLTSFFLAIILSILIMEPLKLLVWSLCIFIYNRQEYAVEDRSDMIAALNAEYQVPDTLRIHVVAKINILRQKPMYMPLSEEAVHKYKRNRISSFLLRIIIADFMCLILCVLLFLAMIYNVIDPSAYLHREDVKGLFNTKMMDVNTQRDLVDYLKDTVIPNLHYYDNVTRNATSNGTIDLLNPAVDEVNFLLGVIRLRQIRKTPEACNHKKAPRWSAHCTMDFDTQNYTESWNKLKKNNHTTMKQPWLYSIPTPRFRGFFMHHNQTYYPTGSYQALLGRTKQISLTKLEYLFNKKWFDFLTTVVYIDFSLYNLNTHQLTLVTLMAERTERGVYYIHTDIEVVKMQQLEAIAQLHVLFYLIVVLLWLVWYVHKESMKYSLLRPKQVFSNKWNSIKKFLLILGIINVMIYTKKILRFEYYTEKISHAAKEDFIDFEALAFWDEFLIILIALMQFLVIIEVCNLFRTCYRVNLALTVVYKSRVMGFFIFLVLLIISFTWAGYLLFGRLSYNFRNFKVGFLSVVTFVLRSFNVGQLGNYHSFFLTFSYYLSILVGFFFVFRWLIAAMMIHSFSAAKRSAHFKPYLPILSNYTKKYFDSIDGSPNRKPFKLSVYLQSIEPRMHAIGHLFVDFYYKTKREEVTEQREMAMDAVAFGVIRKRTKHEKDSIGMAVYKNEREEQARALARSIISKNDLKYKLEYLTAKIDIRIREERYNKMLKLVKIPLDNE